VGGTELQSDFEAVDPNCVTFPLLFKVYLINIHYLIVLIKFIIAVVLVLNLNLLLNKLQRYMTACVCFHLPVLAFMFHEILRELID
jgi:energy-converting hydrogenase Eha subunit A